MRVVIEVGADGPDRPPAGAPVRVELRDTSYADAPAVTLATATGAATEDGDPLASIALELEAVPDGTTVWAHVDVDGDGRVSPGDYITMASWPVPSARETRVAVSVRRV